MYTSIKVVPAEDITDGDIIIACGSGRGAWTSWGEIIVGATSQAGSLFTADTIRQGWGGMFFQLLVVDTLTEEIRGTHVRVGDVLTHYRVATGEWEKYWSGPMAITHVDESGWWADTELVYRHETAGSGGMKRRRVGAQVIATGRVKCSCGKSIPSGLAGAHVH